MSIIIISAFYGLFQIVHAIYPVAIFHSQRTTCVEIQETVDYLKSKLSQASNENVHVECIESGEKTWLTSILSQSETACRLIQANANFQGDFSIIGFSQGALIARYIIQKCVTKAKPKTYISIGGPQMGIGKIPECWYGAVCYFIHKAIGYLVYNPYFQNYLGPAGYFRIPDNQNLYLTGANFLPELNNEKEKDTEIKAKFEALEKLVLIKFLNDTEIFPKDSAWFEFIDENEDVIALENSDLYIKGCLGLDKFIDENRLFKIALEGNNCAINHSVIDTHIIPYLK